MARQMLWFQSGTSGKTPAYDGEAEEFLVHCGLTSVRRLLFLTHLCWVGEATLGHFNRLYGGANYTNWRITQGMVRAGFMSVTEAPVSTRLRPGRGCVAPCRVFRAEEWGRRWLWRYGWVARRVLIPDTCDGPLRDDVPEDPLEALRTCARPEFLRPTAMAIAHRLGRYGGYTRSQMLAATWVAPCNIEQYLRDWRRVGLVEAVELAGYALGPSRERYSFHLTPVGKLALARHVDALRRAAMASGHVPEPDEWRFPHHLDPEWWEG